MALSLDNTFSELAISFVELQSKRQCVKIAGGWFVAGGDKAQHETSFSQ